MQTKETDRRWQDTAGSGRVLRLSIIALLGLAFAAETVADDDRLIGRTLQACSPSRIIDGDTLSVTCDGDSYRVRLHCIDAPEMDQGDWGTRSRDHLSEMIPDQVTIKVTDIGYYGRVIGELSADGMNINRRLVRAGWAAEYPRYCDDPSYAKAQSRAKERKRGVWSEPGMHQTPWVWRRQ